MKSKKLLRVLSYASIFAAVHVQAQNAQQVKKIQSEYNMLEIESLQQKFNKTAKAQKTKALQMAKSKGWKSIIKTKDGRVLELQKVVDGKPIYYTTYNTDAALSTRTNHLQTNGSLGLNLMGQGMVAHVWDGGVARASHREFDGSGGNNRYTIGDDAGLGLNFHAAHVTGTIVAAGIRNDAEGMAPHARAVGYDWNNDIAEAVNAAGNGMLVSNHSYGFAARDRQGRVQLPQYFFGGYIEDSRDWDVVTFNAPDYLPVVAAGNDGNDNSANNNPTGGFGFDKLTGASTSKNTLAVANAQDARVGGNGNLISVSINSSSSEGPTDDLRIKPDITGNGTGVLSILDSSNTAYRELTGTSMASPNVAGSLLLLQQHYNNLNNTFMKAATLKGLALHTADDAGPTGPDAIFGWGLLNAKKAAEVISADGDNTIVDELVLSSGQTYSITVESDGSSPLLSSISWTDRPGRAITSASSAPVLVNDLDIRVSKGENSALPYELTGATTSARRDNNVDPFERVDINNASGTYTITVRAKGNLVGGSQRFSLIVTGIRGSSSTPNPVPPTTVSYCDSKGDNAQAEWIDNIELGGISNTSGAGSGYSNFTSQVGTLSRGSSNTMIVSAAFSGQSYTEFWSVWIDFNKNGTFEASERVVNGSSSSAANLSTTVDVPSNAALGSTRMRVSMKYNAASSPCETFEFGEVEDYTINIIGTSANSTFNNTSIAATSLNSSEIYTTSGGTNTQDFVGFATTDETTILGDEAPTALEVYPNPSNLEVHVGLSTIENSESSYKVINSAGQVLKIGTLKEEQINVSDLTQGLYILEVNDGQRVFYTQIIKK
ncbi:S8 family serine peptidase [Aquimarina agarivorans]|uniref:S8 family serine peptidase n=1 Tax=Aquimarina agarivorans TaxID=980584 RepID=UPI000248EA61|nr:S8 family serine peptidase [Aquimarina agarivorans]